MKGCPPALLSYDMPRALEWLAGLSPSHAWIFTLLWLDLAVLGDLVTGTKVWFGPGYLFVMCLAAWCLGWRAGLLTGIGSIILSFAVNGVALYPHGHVELLSNFVARFVAIAVVIGIVAASRRAYLREWWLARTDPLTGAFNRQAFFELGGDLTKSTTWRLLLYADLDGLKRINDVHGHSSGDAALRAYAGVVRRNIRRNDLFARVGGDEFLIFMSIKDQASGVVVAERLHQQMNRIPQQHGGVSRCSLGALLVPPGEMGIDHLVQLADGAMYRAKLDGASLEIELADHAAPAAEARQFRKRPRGIPGAVDPTGPIAAPKSEMEAPSSVRLAVQGPLSTPRERRGNPHERRDRSADPEHDQREVEALRKRSAAGSAQGRKRAVASRPFEA